MSASPTVAAAPVHVEPSDEVIELLALRSKALADPVRLRIFLEVAGAPSGEICVCDITDTAGRSQATVSHHLKVLRQAGLLTSERRGTWVWYRVDIAALTWSFDTLRTASLPSPEVSGECSCGSACCCEDA